MHELHAADQILHKVVEFGNQKKLDEITDIYIELGTIIEHGEEINSDNLKFNFSNISRGSLAENANLHIKRIRGDKIKIKEIEGQ